MGHKDLRIGESPGNEKQSFCQDSPNGKEDVQGWSLQTDSHVINTTNCIIGTRDDGRTRDTMNKDMPSISALLFCIKPAIATETTQAWLMMGSTFLVSNTDEIKGIQA